MYTMEAEQHRWTMFNAEPDIWMLLVGAGAATGLIRVGARAATGLIRGWHTRMPWQQQPGRRVQAQEGGKLLTEHGCKADYPNSCESRG